MRSRFFWFETSRVVLDIFFTALSYFPCVVSQRSNYCCCSKKQAWIKKLKQRCSKVATVSNLWFTGLSNAAPSPVDQAPKQTPPSLCVNTNRLLALGVPAAVVFLFLRFTNKTNEIKQNNNNTYGLSVKVRHNKEFFYFQQQRVSWMHSWSSVVWTMWRTWNWEVCCCTTQLPAINDAKDTISRLQTMLSLVGCINCISTRCVLCVAVSWSNWRPMDGWLTQPLGIVFKIYKFLQQYDAGAGCARLVKLIFSILSTM